MFNWLVNLFSKKKDTKYTFLTKEDVKAIELFLLDGVSVKDISKKYGVSQTTIYNVKNGKHHFSKGQRIER